AMLPAVAADARLSLPRVNGWMEMGVASALVGGIALGWAVTGPGWVEAADAPLPGAGVAVLLGLNLGALLAAPPTSFPPDVPRPEPPARAAADFFRDLARIGRTRRAAWILLGLAGFQALITTGSGAVVAQTLTPEALEQGGLLAALTLIGLGVALGCLTAGLQ